MSISRILIVDDDPVVLEMLPTYFDVADLEVAAVTATAREVGEIVEKQAVDLVLTDVRMPGFDGIALTTMLRARLPHLPVVGITSYDTDEYVVEMLRAGASGMVLKSAPRQEILYAVREALAGRTYVSTVLAGRLSPYLAPASPSQGPELSDREDEVLTLLLDGLPNADIATRLDISVASVKKHLSSLFTKYGVDSRLKLAVEALRR